MVWFKFILGLIMFFELSILFAIVPEYGNVYMTKESKNWTSFKNHNKYMDNIVASCILAALLYQGSPGWYLFSSKIAPCSHIFSCLTYLLTTLTPHQRLFVPAFPKTGSSFLQYFFQNPWEPFLAVRFVFQWQRHNAFSVSYNKTKSMQICYNLIVNRNSLKW